MAINEDLSKAGVSVEKSIGTQLALCQNSGESYDPDLHVFLKNTLKMEVSSTVKELQVKKEAIEKVGINREVMETFNKIKQNFGDKVILDYPGLLELCKNHNLFFGPTQYFSGNITPEAAKQAKDFNFGKANTILKLGTMYDGEPVINWCYGRSLSRYDLIIMAPISMFKLDGKVLIVNREIIPNPKGTSHKVGKDCPNNDPVLLLPFEAEDKNVYFIVITNW